MHFFDLSTFEHSPALRCFVHLRTRRLSEPTFRPSGVRSHKTLEKHTVSRLASCFAHLHLLSSDFPHVFSSPFELFLRPRFFLALLLAGCAFHLSIFSDLDLPIFLQCSRTSISSIVEPIVLLLPFDDITVLFSFFVFSTLGLPPNAPQTALLGLTFRISNSVFASVYPQMPVSHRRRSIH